MKSYSLLVLATIQAIASSTVLQDGAYPFAYNEAFLPISFDEQTLQLNGSELSAFSFFKRQTCNPGYGYCSCQYFYAQLTMAANAD